jgi:hypothetical protein
VFNITITEINARILVAKQFLGLVRTFEGSKPPEAATCKGLMFVQLYGIYEYSVNSAVQATLSSIRGDGLCPLELHQRALTLVLHSRFISASTAGPRRMWEQRSDLVASIDSTSPLQSLDDTVFPKDGSHYRVRQLQTIWAVFGLAVPVVPEPRLLGRIEELVENRNAIAHGRRTAEEVGGRYSTLEIEKTVDDVGQISSYVVTEMETHYKAGGVRR